MKKKILSLCLFGTMTLSLTGCSKPIGNIYELFGQSKPNQTTESDILSTEEITESTEDLVTNTEDTIEEENTTNNQVESSLIDPETGENLFRLVNYHYEPTDADKSNVIFTFAEPNGWKVNTDYLTDTLSFADTLFFLVNDNNESMTLTCSVPSGIVYLYDQSSSSGNAENAKHYSLEEQSHKTTLNPNFGYDIFKYTYDLTDESLGHYYTVVLYGESDNSFVLELPESELFDTLEEVTDFIDNNF